MHLVHQHGKKTVAQGRKFNYWYLTAGYANMCYIFSTIAEPVGDKGAPRESMNERSLETGA
jgi:hypothetical protein